MGGKGVVRQAAAAQVWICGLGVQKCERRDGGEEPHWVVGANVTGAEGVVWLCVLL